MSTVQSMPDKLTPGTAPADRSQCYVNEDRIRQYHEQGYLVYPDALSQAELDELRQELIEIVCGRRGEVGGAMPPGPGETDDDSLRRTLCVHNPHKISSTMLQYMAHPAIIETLTGIISPNVKSMQSMMFIKAPGKRGQAWHQDEIYIPTRDRSLTGAWIAMDDATVENGCLWVLPGSHRRGLLWELLPHNKPEMFDCSDEASGFPWTDDDAVPVEVKAGSIVFFNGYLLHRSLPNTSQDKYRRALVNHYMSAESLLPWFQQPDVPMAITDFRDVVLVAGEDPYAFKGYDDIVRPHVRPSGEGGCGNAEKHLKDQEADAGK